MLIAKITSGCTGTAGEDYIITALNWLASNAPRGSIVNLSYSHNPTVPCTSTSMTTMDDAIKAVHDAGIILVIAAGNDGCMGDNMLMSKSPYAFVVGNSTNTYFASGYDARHQTSRYGLNVSAYAPGDDPARLCKGSTAPYPFGHCLVSESGTSFSAPLIAGLFAIGCQYYGTCSALSDATVAYNVLRGFGADVVFNYNGTYIMPGQAGRFISKPTLWN